MTAQYKLKTDSTPFEDMSQLATLNLAGVEKEFGSDPVVAHFLHSIKYHPERDLSDIFEAMQDVVVTYSSVILDKVVTDPDNSKKETELLAMWACLCQHVEMDFLDTNSEKFVEIVTATTTLFVTESLYRKGYINLNRKAMTVCFETTEPLATLREQG
jgi:hypothetical protein